MRFDFFLGASLPVRKLVLRRHCWLISTQFVAVVRAGALASPGGGAAAGQGVLEPLARDGRQVLEGAMVGSRLALAVGVQVHVRAAGELRRRVLLLFHRSRICFVVVLASV